MKLIVILLAFCLNLAFCQVSLFEAAFKKLHQDPIKSDPAFKNNIDVKYIEQKLDNFNENDNRTWYMRYFSNDYYFKARGPMFILVGGEWEIQEENFRGGHFYDMAEYLNGYLFYTEHRFYGRSQPFRTLETSNFKYHNVEQALAGLANFILTMKRTIPGLENSKVILIGGSYSASVVTWFNKVYPELVDGTWASSAPLNVLVDFKEYKEVVGSAIKEVGGNACYNRIENAFVILEEKMDNEDLASIKQYIDLCPDFDAKDKNDVMMLFSSLSDIFSALVQNHVKGDIEGACSMIMSAPTDLEGVGKFIKDHLQVGNQCVRAKYLDYVNNLRRTDLDGIMRSWFYQACNEFGWYQTSTSTNQPLGSKFPLDLYLNICRDTFNMTYDRNRAEEIAKSTNLKFGGLNPQVKNVYFTHGQMDPWHAVGILCSGECGAVVPYHTHCKDLGSISPYDSQEMQNLKQTIFDLVVRWTK